MAIQQTNTESDKTEPTIEERLGSIGIDDKVQVTTLAALISELEMEDQTWVIAYIKSVSDPKHDSAGEERGIAALIGIIVEEQDKLARAESNTVQEETGSAWLSKKPKDRLIGILQQLQKIEEVTMGLDTPKTMVDVLRDTPVCNVYNPSSSNNYNPYKQITLKNGSTISVTNHEYTLLLKIQEERTAQISEYDIKSISLLLLKGLIVPNTFDENNRIITVRVQTQEDFENREMIIQSEDALIRLLKRNKILTVETLLIAFHFSLDGGNSILKNLKHIGDATISKIEAFIENNRTIKDMNTQMLDGLKAK